MAPLFSFYIALNVDEGRISMQPALRLRSAPLSVKKLFQIAQHI